ncbi:MerR family transcriptional regulator [bacterium]|nr:MerR family transcriptional regulator [bacterium]MCI0601657.1 MerR family transcriptional regulator [bacterium]
MIKVERYTLEMLSRKMVEFLKEYDLLDAQQDGRVSSVPDSRTVRYYTTLGLLDRPFLEGREARYGRRHILQLLAIKALQGNQIPLSEIQARLYGKTERELESLLASFAKQKKRVSEIKRPLVWREIIIEPGLKVLTEESWSPVLTQSQIEERIHDALKILLQYADKKMET